MSELKPEAILTFLGLDPTKVVNEDQFKTEFETKFGVKELLLKDPAFTGKIFGQKIGSIEAKVKANAKKMGVEFAPDEIKDKGVEEILELSFVKIADLNKKAMDDFEKTSKGSVDEQVKTWKDKYSQLESKHKDVEGLLTKTSADFDGYKKEQVNKGKSDTINNFKKDSIKKLDFKQDITAVERVGFESVLNDKYNFDLDEAGAPFIANKKGERIPSKKTIGTFMTADEILNEEMITNKLAKINKQGGDRVAPKYGNQTQPLAQADGAKTLFIHPAARAAAGG